MRLLDLFCGAGGAAMGYHQAGFNEIVGVDIVPQPNYPFDFIQADALAPPVRLEEFDLIHASPPCQLYSVANNVHQKDHPDLLPPTRALLQTVDVPWVIENVPGAPMGHWALVCGLALGVNVKRHRWFESNHHLWSTPVSQGSPRRLAAGLRSDSHGAWTCHTPNTSRPQHDTPEAHNNSSRQRSHGDRLDEP